MLPTPLTEPAEATYVPCTRKKSGFTNLSEGVVHVFRDGTTKPTPEELDAKTADMPLENLEVDGEGIMLGVLAVPSWMTPSDFLTFVAPAVEGIGHLRIIRYVSFLDPFLIARVILSTGILLQIGPWL